MTIDDPALPQDSIMRLSTSSDPSLASPTARLRKADRVPSLRRIRLASAVHEIRNALGVTQANVELARHRILDHLGPSREASADDHTMGRAIDELNAALLGLQHLDDITQHLTPMRRRPPTRTPVRVDDLVRAAMSLTRSRFPQATRFKTDLGAAALTFVDATTITQITVNLLMNAADALADRADAKVTILTRLSQAGCAIEVSDNGPGIPDGIRARLFEPFATSKDYGTGLGLYTSRRLAEEQGGSLVCETRPQLGTWFRLELPVHAPPGKSPRARAGRKQASRDGGPTTGGGGT